MASLKNVLTQDPTLLAADRALEAQAAEQGWRSQKLGMGEVGGACQRRMWYNFRWAFREVFDAVALKRFADGHKSEDTQAERLRLVEGIDLETLDPVTGKQFTYIDVDGHAKGKCDGRIRGLLQAPVKLHIWEAKAVSEKKLTEFRKIKADLGEKDTLKKWDPTYYAQGQLYMHYEGTDRHYTTVSSPGMRDWDSCRTDYDHAFAVMLKARMNRIIKSNEPLDKVSDKPDWFECKMCPMRGVCHESEMPDRNCRTCLHSTPIANGAWHCDRWGKTLTADEQQAGCAAHKFLPPLVPGEVITASDTAVHYRMPDGSEWIDGEGYESA